MAEKQPKVPRVARSYRALHVSWPTRWRLGWSARIDRRAGLPVGLNADTTPALRGLVARRDEACEHERTRYLTAVQPLIVRLAELEPGLASLDRLQEERTAEAVRVRAPLTERQLSIRHLGEQNLPQAVVRRRRETEHRRAAEAAEAARFDARQRFIAARSERAELEALRRSRADVARSRVLRYVDHADRLAAIYRRDLLRRHPQREALVRAWSTNLYPPPPWVLADELAPSRTTGAAA